MSIALPAADEIVMEERGVVESDDCPAKRLLIGRKGVGDQAPALLFLTGRPRARQPGTVVVHEYGKAALMREGLRAPGPLVSGLLEAGQAVLAVDALLCGEYNTQAGMGTRRNRQAAHFTTYNRPDAVECAQDILTAIAVLTETVGAAQASLVGLGEAGLWCLLAAAAAPQAIRRLAADLARFDPECDAEFLERLNVPHIRRAGDLLSAAALYAPRPLLIYNLADQFDTAAMRRVYRVVGQPRAFASRQDPVSESSLARWITARR